MSENTPDRPLDPMSKAEAEAPTGRSALFEEIDRARQLLNDGLDEVTVGPTAYLEESLGVLEALLDLPDEFQGGCDVS